MGPGVLSRIGKKNYDDTDLDNEVNEDTPPFIKARSPIVHDKEDVITQSKLSATEKNKNKSFNSDTSLRQRTNSSINFSDGDFIISKVRPPTARKRPSIAVQPQASNHFVKLKDDSIENSGRDEDSTQESTSNEVNSIPTNPTARPSTAEAVNVKTSAVKITTSKHITKNKPTSSPTPKSLEGSSMKTTFKETLGDSVKEKVQMSFSTYINENDKRPSASGLSDIPKNNADSTTVSNESKKLVNTNLEDETTKIKDIQKKNDINAEHNNNISEKKESIKEEEKEETDQYMKKKLSVDSDKTEEILTSETTYDNATKSSPCNSTKKEKKKKLKGKGGSSPKFCSSNQSLLSLLKNEKKLLSTETSSPDNEGKNEEDSNVFIVGGATEVEEENPESQMNFDTDKTTVNNDSTHTGNVNNDNICDTTNHPVNTEEEPAQDVLLNELNFNNATVNEVQNENPQEYEQFSRMNNYPNEFGDGSVPCSKCQENPPELPLVHYSAALGHTDCIYEMYQIKKAALFSFDVSTRSPLFYACANGQLECVELLLSLSPQLACLGDANGDSPLHAAACSGFDSCCSALLNHSGININAVNNVGMMPSHIGKNRKILELLFEKGADFGSQDIQGRTPLFVACAMNRPDCVSFLLEYLDMSECVDLPNKKGDTPLHAAALYGHKDCCIKLLEYGAQPELKNAKGLTAIDLARKTKHKRCLKTLMDYRLHHSVNFDTVLFLASLEGHKQLLEMAKANESINTALISNNHDIKLKHFKNWLAYKYTDTKTFYYNTVTGEGTEIIPEEVKTLATPEELARLDAGSEKTNVSEEDPEDNLSSFDLVDGEENLKSENNDSQKESDNSATSTRIEKEKVKLTKHQEVLSKAGKVTQEGAKNFFNMLNTLGAKISNGLKLDEYPSEGEDDSDDSSVSTTSSVDSDYSTDSSDSEVERRKSPLESQKSLYVAKSMRIIEKGEWIKYYGGGAKSFYYNTQTGDFTNTEPIEDTAYDKEGHEWQTYKDESSGLYFYYNTVTGVSQWHKPGTEEYEETRENEEETDVHEIQDVNELEL